MPHAAGTAPALLEQLQLKGGLAGPVSNRHARLLQRGLNALQRQLQHVQPWEIGAGAAHVAGLATNQQGLVL